MLLIIVHRLLQSFLLPPLNAMIIMLLGIIFIFFKKRYGAWIILFGWIFLYIQSLPLTAYLVSKKYELPPLQKNQLANSQAIVVLGGGVNKNGPEYQLGVNLFQASIVRLNYTAYLAKQYPDKLIVTSGGYAGNVREADIMYNQLINIYGIKNPVIMENRSRNTDENAKFVADILLPRHIKNIVLVTQASHMQRSVMLFKKYGLNPIAASTDYYAGETPPNNTSLALIPTVGAMHQVARFYHELLGYLIYK